MSAEELKLFLVAPEHICTEIYATKQVGQGPVVKAFSDFFPGLDCFWPCMLANKR